MIRQPPRPTRTDTLSLHDALPISLKLAKAHLRSAAIARRREAYHAAADAPHRLLGHFLKHIPCPPGAAVSGFWPMGEEIDVRPLLLHLHARGHAIGLPATGPRGSVLRFRRWDPEVTLVSGVFGTRAPPADPPEVAPDLLIVPLLAFDADGWRGGYGGGYSDRQLAYRNSAV